VIWLRSFLFAISLAVTTPLFCGIALLTFALPFPVRYRIITLWSQVTIGLAKHLCGIHYRVKGLENLPNRPAVVLSKHQSAWETLAYQVILPPQVWVLKKELLRIPFFGWGLAMLNPIAIDRETGHSALKQVLDQGKDRLSRGFWVVVFPEGTRIKPGEKGKYNVGGAWLASHTDTPVVPVAHNAGEYWGKKAFLKHPGCITVSIGKPIYPDGRKATQLLQIAEEWIENEMRAITHQRYLKPLKSEEGAEHCAKPG